MEENEKAMQRLLDKAEEIGRSDVMAMSALLNEAADAHNKYFERYNHGEMCNIFKAVNPDKYKQTEKIHSRFIAFLLDSSSPHACGAKFLKAFCNMLQLNFNYDAACVTKEMRIGETDEDKENGGQIDIIIEQQLDDERAIVIENKLGAGDQEGQLLRYKNYCNNKYSGGNYLIYLTVDGHPASDLSTGGKLADEDYIKISYAKHITAWLKECLDIAKDKPLVRNAIEQYLEAVKSITTEKYMEESMETEVVDLLLKDRNMELAETMSNSIYAAKCKAFGDNIFPVLKENCKITETAGDVGEKYFGFGVYKEEWAKRDLCIRFIFTENGFVGLQSGICAADDENGIPSEIKEHIINKRSPKERNTIKTVGEDEKWPIYDWMQDLPVDYRDWDAKKFCDIMKNPKELCDLVNKRIKRYSEIIEDALKAEEATTSKKQK